MQLVTHFWSLAASLGWILGSNPTSATFLAKWPGVSHLGWSRGVSLPQFLALSTVIVNAADQLGLGDETNPICNVQNAGRSGKCVPLSSGAPGDGCWETLHVLLETGRQRIFSIKLTRSSGLDEIFREAVICIFICIYLHKKYLTASSAFRMIALLGVPEPLLPKGSFKEESHAGEGAFQRSHPWGELHTQPPPGLLTLGATLMSRSLLHPTPRCFGL